MNKTTNLNLSIVRNVAYNKIKKMQSTIKDVIEVDDELLKMIDINMKNAINKIIHDYRVYKQTGVMKVK
jgi:transcriptional regulator